MPIGNICCLVIWTLHVCCCRTLHCGRIWETAIQRSDRWLMMFAKLRGSLITGQLVYLRDLLHYHQPALLWDPPVNYYSISRRQGSISNPRHSASWHQLSGTLCLQLRKVPLPSPLSRHIWKLNCSLLHTTRSKISSAARNSLTHGAAYECFRHWHWHHCTDTLIEQFHHCSVIVYHVPLSWSYHDTLEFVDFILILLLSLLFYALMCKEPRG